MVNIVKDDKISKKKKTVRKTAKRKAKTSHTRNIDMAISYGSINIRNRGGKKRSYGKIFRMLFMLIFISTLAFLCVYAYNHLMEYLCSLENFFIENIEITGCENVTESEIKELIPFQKGDSSFAVRLGQAEKDLKEFKAELKDISMHRTDWGRKIIVSVKERSPEVFIDVNDKRFGLDFDDKPFNLRGNMSSMHIPTLVFNNDEERKDLLSFYHKIKSQIKNVVPGITEIKYGEVEDIILTVDEKTDIYWGSPKEKNSDDKISKLKQVLDFLATTDKNIDSVDLSFLDMNKNKVLVKYSVVDEASKV